MLAVGKTILYRNFIDLKQEDISIAKYESMFNELSHFNLRLIDALLKKKDVHIGY